MTWRDVSPLLVVEVLYEGDPKKDLVRNVAIYFAVPSITEYWVVDGRANPDEPTLIVHRRYRQRWVVRRHSFGSTYSPPRSPDSNSSSIPPRNFGGVRDGTPRLLAAAAAPPRLPHRLRRGRVHHARLPPRRLPQRRASTPSPSPRATRPRPAPWPSGTASRPSTTPSKPCSPTRTVEVLDVAVPPDVQPGLIRPGGRRAGIVRASWPRSRWRCRFATARDCVEACARAGIVLAVNQNMRYDQSVRALKDLLTRGVLGEPVLATIDMRAIPHWMPWSERPAVAGHVRHEHPPPRHVPLLVRHARPRPGQHPARPADHIPAYATASTCTSSNTTTGLRCRVVGRRVGGAVPRGGGAGDIGIRWRVEGTDGMARGTIGWPNYPARVPSTLDYTTTRTTRPVVQAALGRSVVPGCLRRHDGATARRPRRRHRRRRSSGRDNLETVALCEAVFAGAKEHRVTTVREFLN